MKIEEELLRMLSEAEDDVQKGRVKPIQDSFDEIRAYLLGKNEKNGR